jgi:hypothetical protein
MAVNSPTLAKSTIVINCIHQTSFTVGHHEFEAVSGAHKLNLPCRHFEYSKYFKQNEWKNYFYAYLCSDRTAEAGCFKTVKIARC